MADPVAFPTDAWSSPALDGAGQPIYRDAPAPTGNRVTPSPGQPAATAVWEEITPLDASTPTYRFVCAAGRPWPAGRVF